MLNDDNDETRRAVEMCYRTKKTLVNPIIDWKDEDVWEFIKTENLPYCELYDCGYTRLGCIGCPMGKTEFRIQQLEQYPKHREAYIRAFGRMLDRLDKKGIEHRWQNAEEVMAWWLNISDM